ncbi:MAG: hypothetical protein HN731_07950 [Rhodospirillaceae bacterium]|jgi:hypothetical protein|nr:hypothetical protein [Rhodospirillaceae bacterium]
MPILDRTAAELPVTIKASSYTLLPTDVGTELQFLNASAITAILPPVAEVENGYNIVIRNIGAGTLTIDPSGSEQIDGVTTLALATDDWQWIRSDATEWKTVTSNSTDIADGSVTTAKIANNAVDGTKIAMGSDAQGDVLYYNGTDYVRLGAGTSGQVLQTNGSAANPSWVDAASGGGKVVQVVNVIDGAVSTGTTTLPYDDTIPQNTEGNEFITLSITPNNSSNLLKIESVICAASPDTTSIIAALFQDSTAGALASIAKYQIANNPTILGFTHYMTAGTTSATTFKVRIGINASGTITFNGQSSGRKLGGNIASSITITEIEV